MKLRKTQYKTRVIMQHLICDHAKESSLAFNTSKFLDSILRSYELYSQDSIEQTIRALPVTHVYSDLKPLDHLQVGTQENIAHQH